ncbi:ROK family protein [Brachybacterium sp. DNPG3]
MIEIVPGGASFLGFKLTGDALYAAVIDLAGEVVRVASGELSDTSPEAVIEQIARATAALRGRHPRLSAVGVCLAGDVRHDPSLGAVVTDSAFLGWDETPLQRPLAEATGLPVAISNDVQALTMGHHWFGAGRGTSSLAVLGLGAGIGCGLVLEGGRVDGANGHPGKVGHLPVGLDDARCDHGHAGCVSAYVTIPAILRRLGAEDFEAVLAAHAEQDPEAVAALRRAAVALGAVVATITNLVDPERVVVTGEALAVARLHPDVLEGAVRERLDPSSVAPEIVCPDFAFTDYARGAAVTALHALV